MRHFRVWGGFAPTGDLLGCSLWIGPDDRLEVKLGEVVKQATQSPFKLGKISLTSGLSIFTRYFKLLQLLEKQFSAIVGKMRHWRIMPPAPSDLNRRVGVGLFQVLKLWATDDRVPIIANCFLPADCQFYMNLGFEVLGFSHFYPQRGGPQAWLLAYWTSPDQKPQFSVDILERYRKDIPRVEASVASLAELIDVMTGTAFVPQAAAPSNRQLLRSVGSFGLVAMTSTVTKPYQAASDPPDSPSSRVASLRRHKSTTLDASGSGETGSKGKAALKRVQRAAAALGSPLTVATLLAFSRELFELYNLVPQEMDDPSQDYYGVFEGLQLAAEETNAAFGLIFSWMSGQDETENFIASQILQVRSLFSCLCLRLDLETAARKPTRLASIRVLP